MKKKYVITIVISSIIVFAIVLYLISLAIISRPSFKISNYESISNEGTLLIQAFDNDYAIGHMTSENNRRWAKKNKYDFKIYKNVTQGEKPHFMRYRAILEAFKDPNIKYVVYVDGDAVLSFDHAKLYKAKGKELTFGNEFLFHNHWGWLTKKSPINSGYIAAQNTPYVANLFDKLLKSDSCKECRTKGCGLHGFKDQGCLDKLLKNRKINKSKIGIIQVQSRKWPTTSLLIHPAGTTDPTFSNLKTAMLHFKGRG